VSVAINRYPLPVAFSEEEEEEEEQKI